MTMAQHYDKHYFFADKYGGKPFIDSAGEQKTFGYFAGGIWNFQALLNKFFELFGTPKSVLDIGAGCGGWAATLNDNYLETLGLEFSDYAIQHAVMDGEKYLKHWDLEVTPWPLEDRYDWITAIDLYEHLFKDKIDDVIAETKRWARKWIIAKICTAELPREIWAAKRAPYEEVIAQAKREGFEWLVVSGHVNSQMPQYWIDKFVDDDWKLRPDLADQLRNDLKLPHDWRTTLICENIHWFEQEFG